MRALSNSPFVSVALALLLWWAATPMLQLAPRYLPPPGLVVADIVANWRDFGAGFLRTMLETVVGLALGGALGVFVGIVFARFQALERGLFPIFIAFQSVPVIAFGAIVVIWFGPTLASKVAIALHLSFFPVVVNTLRGLREADAERVALLRSFGATYAQRLLMLELPTAAPSILAGLQTGVSLALAGAIVGEWFGDTVGLGVMLLQALYFEAVPRLWALIATTAALGLALHGALALAERRLAWWRTW